jgi:hypothetical protein
MCTCIVSQILGSKWFEDQRVAEVSTRSGRGKHTTRHVSLLPLSGGGYLADTPGFNQPSLLKVTKQSLAQTFPEVSMFMLYPAVYIQFFLFELLFYFFALFRSGKCLVEMSLKHVHSAIACILVNLAAL